MYCLVGGAELDRKFVRLWSQPLGGIERERTNSCTRANGGRTAHPACACAKGNFWKALPATTPGCGSPNDVIEKLLLRAGTLSSFTAAWREARAHCRTRGGAARRAGAARPAASRRGVHPTAPPSRNLCGGGEGRWKLEWGAASLTGRLAARLSRPAHAPAALWRHAVGSRHWAAAAAEPMRPGGRGGEPHLCTPPFDRRRAPCSSQRHSSHSAHGGSAPTAAPQKATPSAARCAAAAPCAHAALHASTYAHAHAHACAKVAQGGGGGRGGGRQARVRASRAGLSKGQETSAWRGRTG